MYDINLIIATIAKVSSINFTILMLLPSHFLRFTTCDAVTLLYSLETKCTLHTYRHENWRYERKLKLKLAPKYEKQDTISGKGIQTWSLLYEAHHIRWKKFFFSSFSFSYSVCKQNVLSGTSWKCNVTNWKRTVEFIVLWIVIGTKM